MCGIAAIFAYHDAAPPVDMSSLLRIRDHMIRRGPDGSGAFESSDHRIALGHRRLSIIDLSESGAQPMQTADGAFVIIFNGEIYNYRVLRAELEEKGCQFQSHSDTEVLLQLYARKGRKMVDDLRGMYTFIIWDRRRQGIFIARDPFGIKPLYYADDGKTLRVASQVKALLAGGGVDTSLNPAGHVGFFLWGHVPSPYTFYKGIRSLPEGTSLWVDRHGNKTFDTFCTVPEVLTIGERHAPKQKAFEALERIADALQDTVRHHLIADVPVGVFLSSGLDSTSLASLAAAQGGELRTVTLGFEEYKGTANDETILAEQVAARYHAKHQTVWVSRKDFQDQYEQLFQSMDQPSTDGVNTYFVSLAASRASLKVALSGLGGDEILGGYPGFRDIPRAVRAISPFRHLASTIGKGFRLISSPILSQFTSPKYAGLLEYGGTYAGAYLLRRGMFMPWELPEILDPGLAQEGWRELQPLLELTWTLQNLKVPHVKVACLELCWYMRNQLLRDSDWASMAHSIELRVPLVDLKFLRKMAPLMAAGRPPTKKDMCDTLARPLPPEILNRRKTGFLIPVREWLQASGGTGPLPPTHTTRGLRGWAQVVYQRYTGATQSTQPHPHTPSTPNPRPHREIAMGKGAPRDGLRTSPLPHGESRP